MGTETRKIKENITIVMGIEWQNRYHLVNRKHKNSRRVLEQILDVERLLMIGMSRTELLTSERIEITALESSNFSQ